MTMQERSNRSTILALGLALALVWALSGEQRADAESGGVEIESNDPPANPGDETFDHVGTRFIITGSHTGVACESCHAMGVFRGTPTQCGFCHDGSGMRAESGKPIDHIPTSNQCDDCHTTFTWLEVRFEHSGVSGECRSCHNGMQAEGKPLGHPVTNLDCDFCHNTYVWGNIRFDHSGVTQPCSSCHNGTDATGKDMGHIVTNAECDVCHSTRAWSPIVFDHDDVTQPCSSCHDGVGATGTPSGHFMSSQECDACHTTRAWVPDIFRHMSPSYPGDHARDLSCTRCHPGNSDAVVYTDDPGLAPDCAGCHRNDFKAGEHKQYENPDHNYTADELRDCTGACHVYTDSTLTVIKDRRSGEHRVSDRDF
jgi:hypothetical protein